MPPHDWPLATDRTIGERIKLARTRAELRQDDVAERLGVTREAVSLWENNRTIPTLDKLSGLAAFIGCPTDWLLTGEGAAEAARVTNAAPLERRERPPVPLLAKVPHRGRGVPAEPQEAEAWLVPQSDMGAAAFALRVVGDSMEPEFCAGSVIFVDSSLEAKDGDFVVVTFHDSEESTFKQLVIDAGRRYLKPLNSRYPVRELNGGEIRGVVREQRKLYR